MKILPILAAAVLFTGLGIIIGRTSVKGSSEEMVKADPKNQRSARRSGVNVSDASRIGKVGGAPPISYKNRVAHIKALAKEAIGRHQGVPDFDALFGVWETARDMDASEIQLALQDLEKGDLNMQEGMFIKAMLVMQLAKKDGSKAIAYAQNQRRGSVIPMMSMALQAWSSNDQEGAYAWYEKNKEELNPREATDFLAITIAGLAEKNFTDAFAKAKNVNKLSQSDVLSRFGAAIAENSEYRRQFTEYLMTLEDEDIKNKAASSLAGQLVYTDVTAARQYAESWEGADNEEIVESVVRQWAHHEPKEAIEWKLGQIDDLGSVSRTFGDWASDDAKSARQWLDGQPDNPDKDELAEAASQMTIWNQDYSGAVEWASNIVDEGKRTEGYANIYGKWSHTDKAAAQEWANGLDEKTRKAVVPQRADP